MSVYLEDRDVTILHGDAVEQLATLADGSVDCACGCGERHSGYDSRGRPKRFVRRGHNLKGDDNYMATAIVNPFHGRRHSLKTKAILSEKASIPKPWLRGAGNGMSGRTGASNPNWKGGVSPERQRLYANAEYRALLTSVRKRDGLRCTKCRTPSGPLHVHHVKSWAEYPELRFDPGNLVTLCKDCHDAEHRKEVRHQ